MFGFHQRLHHLHFSIELQQQKNLAYGSNGMVMFLEK
jgi:hypothetical protein